MVLEQWSILQKNEVGLLEHHMQELIQNESQTKV